MDEFLEQALGQDNDSDDEDDVIMNAFLTQTVHVFISEERFANCLNSRSIESNKKMVILDDRADTSVIGSNWEITAIHPSRKACVIGFDHKSVIKRNLDIVTALTVVEVDKNQFYSRSTRRYTILQQNTLFSQNISFGILV